MAADTTPDAQRAGRFTVAPGKELSGELTLAGANTSLYRHDRERFDTRAIPDRSELTYELSHRMLRRYLKETAASPDEIDPMPFADLVRTANAHGLPRGDWPVWRRLREMRARTGR